MKRHEDDLLAEAQVFAKYGLQEKARDRLRELLELNPLHIHGLRLLTALHLKTGHHEEVVVQANALARLARQTGQQEPWQELRAELLNAGYRVERDHVLAAPGELQGSESRIAQLLEDLRLEGGARPEPTPSAKAAQVVSLVEELGLAELDAELAIETAAASPPAVSLPGQSAPSRASEPPPDLLDETGMSWLDEVQAPSPAAASPKPETIFDEEDDFFDLASELQRELGDDDFPGVEPTVPQEQTLEDIIEGFKRGVAENLSPEDYDTHFNLGIAYREMGLLDEAIGEFQLAAKDARYLVDCSSLLGMCFLDKGLPELAVKWYRKGLEAPAIPEEATLGLLYDMGSTFLVMGDAAAAYRTFVEIYGIRSNYRDVAAKLQQIAPPAH